MADDRPLPALRHCVGCRREATELREGFCWDCANAGERKAARRSVLQHLRSACYHMTIRRFDYARFDLKWAWGRLTHTGDYRKGGYFEREGHI